MVLERDLDGVVGVDVASFTNPWTRQTFEWEARNSDVAHVFVLRSDQETAGRRLLGLAGFQRAPHQQSRHPAGTGGGGVWVRRSFHGCSPKACARRDEGDARGARVECCRRALYERFHFGRSACGAPTTPIRSKTPSSCGAKDWLIRLHAGGRVPEVSRSLHGPHAGYSDKEARMTTDAQGLKTHLLQTDPEFRQLADTHRDLDHRLQELSHKHYLSDHEQFEEVTLKKRKLQLKDRMEDIMRQHRTDVPSRRTISVEPDVRGRLRGSSFHRAVTYCPPRTARPGSRSDAGGCCSPGPDHRSPW